jgi:hypothetical protein
VFRTPTGASTASNTITLTFPAGFNVSSVLFSDIDLAHSAGGQSNCTAPTYTNDEVLAAAATASDWGASVAGQVLTLTLPTDGVGVSAIAANACVRIKIGTNASTGSTGVNQIVNPGTAGNYTLSIAGSFGDSGNIALNILNNDQVSVSASVTESLTFTIATTTVAFGTLSPSGAKYATDDLQGSTTETQAHDIVVGTNASNGYTMTVNGATLTYGPNIIDAIGSTNTASTPGTEQFGLRMNASGGVGSVSAPYAASGFAFATTSMPSQVASATGASSNTTYSVRYLANIGSATEAGAYTTALTYAVTANF